MKTFFTMRSLSPGRPIPARLTSVILSVCLALTLLISKPTPSRADYWDDVKAKASQCGEAVLDQGSLALDVVGTGPRVAACASTLAGSNAGGIAITGLVAGLYLAGKFDTEDQCQGLLVTLIAEQLAKLIQSAPPVQNAIKSLVEFLGGDGDEAIKAFLDLAAGEAVNIMQEIDGAKALFGYFGCACTVIGGSAELQKQMDKANDSKNECLGPIGEALAFFEDLNGEVLGFLLGLIPDFDVFASPDLGLHYYITPDAAACPLNVSWTSGDVPYTKAYAEFGKGQLVLPDNAGAVFPETGMCICPSGTLPKMEWNEAKTVLSASCACPEGEKFDANNQCISQCEYGTKYDYITDHRCEPICKYGVFQGYATTSPKKPICVTTCDDPVAVFNWDKGKCEVCGPNSKTIRTGIGEDDSGRCESCGADAKLTANNTCESYCEKNDWTTHKVNFLGHDVCENICPRGQQWVELPKKGDGGANPWTCQDCGQGTQINPHTNVCEPCAQGAKWIPGSANFGAQCQCPSGLAPVDGVCQTCPGGVIPSSDGNGILVCPTCTGGGDCTGGERIACYLDNGFYENRKCTRCADDEHVSKGACVKNERKIIKVKNPLADKPCDRPNEVREAATLECVPCGDKAQAIGNKCWPIPQTSGVPTAPQILAAKCDGENEVQDPYSLRCVTCGDAAVAFNNQCLAKANVLKVPTKETMPKAKLVSLDPAQKSCPAGTYPLGEKYCQQDILPQGQTAAGRCAPKGANMVFDGRTGGGCTPCEAGAQPNAGRTTCVRLAARTTEPTRPQSGKAIPAKADPAAKGAAIKPDDKPDVKGTAAKPKKQEIKGTAVTPKLPEGTKPKSIAPDLDSDGPSLGSRPGAGTPSLPGVGIGGAAPGGNRKP